VKPGSAALEKLLRPLAPQVLEALGRRSGRFDVCEDAVQENGSGSWPRCRQRSEPQDTRAATADEASRTSERGRLVVDRVVEPCGVSLTDRPFRFRRWSRGRSGSEE
jgi:hypothetical protein